MSKNMIYFFTFLTCFYFIQPTIASHINIVNENKKALTVRIKPEGSGAEDATFVKQIPAEQYYTFSVEQSDISGKSFFSIKGDTSPFTPGDKCNLLNVGKNYKVTFLSDTVGTTCVAEEIITSESGSVKLTSNN